MEASAALELGAGHDDNMLLQAAPADGAPVPSMTLLRLGGPFAEVAPSLGAGLVAGGFRFEASYDGDYRYAREVGHLYYQEGQLNAFFPALGPLRLDLGLVGGRFDAERFADDRFLFGGGEAGLRVGLHTSVRVLSRYRFEVRRLGGAVPTTDLLHAPELRLAYRPTSWLELGPRISLVLVEPRTGDDSTRFRRVRFALDANATVGSVAIATSVWAGALELASVTERHVGGRAEVRWPLGLHVELFATLDLAQPVSAGASQDYARRMFAMGLTTTLASKPAAALPAASADQRPLVEGDKVRFRLLAPGAGTVTVVGSWDDWQAPGLRLAATREPGLYELWMPLPPGSHRYRFLVDGQARKPPDAPRYAPDGFGSEDGVIERGVGGQSP